VVDAGDDGRHAALLLAEREQRHVLEQEGGADGEQHAVLLARRHLDDAAEEQDLEQDADRADDHRGDQEGQRERQAPDAVDVVDHEAADHEHLPVREVEQVHDREDQRDAERHQRVGGRQHHAVDDDLLHRRRLPGVF
jgi:hypothetical protein